MTKEEFNLIVFTGGMTANFKGNLYPVISVDFEEGLIGLEEFESEEGEDPQVSWKRFENIIGIGVV